MEERSSALTFAFTVLFQTDRTRAIAAAKEAAAKLAEVKEAPAARGKRGRPSGISPPGSLKKSRQETKAQREAEQAAAEAEKAAAEAAAPAEKPPGKRKAAKNKSRARKHRKVSENKQRVHKGSETRKANFFLMLFCLMLFSFVDARRQEELSQRRIRGWKLARLL